MRSQWCDRHGQGPKLRRADIARWIAAWGGQGTVWIDDGPAGRVLSEPSRAWQGASLDLLGALPLPKEIEAHQHWAGWLSYDCAAAELSPQVNRTGALPGVGLRLYSGALRLFSDGSYAVEGRAPWTKVLLESAGQDLETPDWGYGELKAKWDLARYTRAFDTIGQRLRQGDTYQINLSHPMSAPLRPGKGALEAAVQSFARLAELSPAPYGAFVDVDGDKAILCNSPELLFSLQPQGHDWAICTGPIKGTRPRGATPAQDRLLVDALLSSEKDAAEHLMIVDLLRNDLVRVAKPGTVRAPATPSLLTLPTVHHLETKIEALLHPQCGALDLWRALAPGGSVTGAPKRRSVEIIDALEGEARGVYCGSIFVGDAQGFAANIAIRTGEARDGALHLRSGGGIVLDSQVQCEWDETFDKARAFAAPTTALRRE